MCLRDGTASVSLSQHAFSHASHSGNAMFPHLSLHGNAFPHLFCILSDAELVPTPLFSDLRDCENRDRGVQYGPNISWQDQIVLLHETHRVILPGCGGVDLPNGYSENTC